MKRFAIILIPILIINIMLTGVQAATGIKIQISDEIIKFPDIQPYSDKNGIIYAPAELIVKALGANYDFDNTYNLIKISTDKFTANIDVYTNSIHLTSSDNVCSKYSKLPYKCTKKGKGIMIPLKFIAEYIGCSYKWDSRKRVVTLGSIDYKNVFFNHPALPYGMYVVDGESGTLGKWGAGSGKVSDFLTEMKMQHIQRSEDLLEILSNTAPGFMDYTCNEENHMFSPGGGGLCGIDIEQYKNWTQTAKQYNIVKKVRLITSIPDVYVTPDEYQYTIRGKLYFVYREPTKKEYLDQFNPKIEVNKWYSTDIQLYFFHGTSNAMFGSIYKITLGKKVEKL